MFIYGLKYTRICCSHILRYWQLFFFFFKERKRVQGMERLHILYIVVVKGSMFPENRQRAPGSFDISWDQMIYNWSLKTKLPLRGCIWWKGGDVLITHYSCRGMSQHVLRKTAYFSVWGWGLPLFKFSDIVLTLLKKKKRWNPNQTNML